MTARNHHYLSQCYLRNFANYHKKKPRLVVVSTHDGSSFETSPRNVGAMRDFNRISTPGVAEDYVEKGIADFEGEVAHALRLIEDGYPFEDDIKTVLLQFLSMLAVRIPPVRESRDRGLKQMADMMMGNVVATRERWEAQIAQLRAAGEVVGEVSYDEARKFYEERQYEIEIPRERHIEWEFKQWQIVLDLLSQRHWALLKTEDDDSSFITSDNPVSLVWRDEQVVPLIYRRSPGFGYQNTELYFPLTKSYALVGTNGGNEGTYVVGNQHVSIINGMTIAYASKRVFSPTIEFKVMNSNSDVVSWPQYLADQALKK